MCRSTLARRVHHHHERVHRMRPRRMQRGWVPWMLYYGLWRRGAQHSLGSYVYTSPLRSSCCYHLQLGFRLGDRPRLLRHQPSSCLADGARRALLSTAVRASDLKNGGDASESIIAASSPSSSSSSSLSPNAAAERAFRTLSRRTRGSDAWERFRPLVDMAIRASLMSSPLSPLSPAVLHGAPKHEERAAISNRPARGRTMVDVGCDHGLLSACLAVAGCFDRVVGIDSSRAALEAGALTLHSDMEAFRQKQQQQQRNDPQPPALALEYRAGNGLRGLQAGEADVMCLAGMGVRTMIEILTERVDSSELSDAKGGGNTRARMRLDEIDCHTVLVQPTNARPRNLIRLYEALTSMGYAPIDERIACVGSRWYFSAAFAKRTSATPLARAMPGSLLVESGDEVLERSHLLGYLSHYCQWLHNDARIGPLKGGEDEWLTRFDQARIQLDSRYK